MSHAVASAKHHQLSDLALQKQVYLFPWTWVCLQVGRRASLPVALLPNKPPQTSTGFKRNPTPGNLLTHKMPNETVCQNFG